jgi:multidrug efflux pump subunit AcrA (membrane-fusion protein)
MAKDQTALLEELRNRHHDAQVRFQEAQKAFQAAQADHATAQANLQKAQQAFAVAQQQFHGWGTAYAAVMAEEAERKQAAQQSQLQLPNAPDPSAVAAPAVQPEPMQVGEQKSKTDVIRDLLRRNPNGLTPTEIWSQVHEQFKYRAYLYSVLKRLTDREELRVSRGKYAIRIIPQEVKGGEATIQ